MGLFNAKHLRLDLAVANILPFVTGGISQNETTFNQV